MALSEQWERRLDNAYEWGSTAFLSLTRSGNIIGLLAPSQLGKGTVEEWNKLHGSQLYGTLPNRTTIRELLSTLARVEQALFNLGLRSASLIRLKKSLDAIISKDGDASLDERQVIAGYEKNALIAFTNEEVLLIYSNMVNFIGLDAAKKIVKLQDNEDRLLMVSFLDISLGSRGFQGVKNIPTRRAVRSEQLSFRGEARRRHKMSTVNSSNIMEVAMASFDEWNSWGIDYPALKRVLSTQTSTFASVDELGKIMEAVAPALNVPVQAVQSVIFLECGWPEHQGRKRTGYRNSMPRDDGETLYRGVSQASKGFWIDVSEQLRKHGIVVAGVPERATLAAQVIAPFIYTDRYRQSPVNGKRLTEWPLTPGIVYSFHQQSRQGLGNGFTKIAGKQSGISAQVVLATGLLYRRRAPTVFI